VSSTKNDFEPTAEAEMMTFIEEKERLLQLQDEAKVREFWALKE
jgi:hypothetical protein